MSSIIIPGHVVRPEFDDAEHLYTVGGVRVPSVSRILRPLTNAVYGEIDRETLRRAADFGTAVHACTELLDLDELDEDSVTPEWMPYLNAYKRWKAATRPEILHIEDRLGCSKYAGTLDRICRINGELWVIDIKTTSSIHPHVGVQLAAYVPSPRVTTAAHTVEPPFSFAATALSKLQSSHPSTTRHASTPFWASTTGKRNDHYQRHHPSPRAESASERGRGGTEHRLVDHYSERI